jgi:hypothetical protein
MRGVNRCQAALLVSYAVVPEIELSGYADKKPHIGAYPESILSIVR